MNSSKDSFKEDLLSFIKELKKTISDWENTGGKFARATAAKNIRDLIDKFENQS